MNSKRSREGRYIQVILALVLIVLAASCTKTEEVYFHKDQSWEVKHSFTYDRDVIPSIGFSILEQVGIRIKLDAITNEFVGLGLNQLAHVYRNSGLEAEWNERRLGDKQTFELKIRGSGINDLADLGLGGDPAQLADLGSEYADYIGLLANQVLINERGDGSIHLSIQQPDGFGDLPLFQTQFILHAGKILSSNATSERSNKAVWESPTEIEVVFLPIQPFWPQYWWIFAVVGGVLIAGVVLFLVIRNSSQKRVRSHRGRRTSRFYSRVNRGRSTAAQRSSITRGRSSTRTRRRS